MNRHTSQSPDSVGNQRVDMCRALSLLLGALIVFSIGCGAALAEDSRSKTSAAGGLWARDNLIAWIVGPFDTRRRSSEERAEMLSKLGFSHYSHLWIDPNTDVSAFDAEISALKRHGITPLAWWFPFDADEPKARATLEIFKRHRIQPQLWVIQSIKPGRQTVQPKDLESLSPEQRREVRLRAMRQDVRKTPQEQAQRVAMEAERIRALVKLAQPYGSKVHLYNHNGWFGMMPNQVAIIEHLRQQGIDDVGIVYNFSHARDELHDDTLDFPAIWKLIQPYTVAVNITGMQWEGTYVYPSQGDYELEMMRIIQQSGWKGHIGLIAEKGGDDEITLRNYFKGFDWLVTELERPGSAGPRPFPPFEGTRTD